MLIVPNPLCTRGVAESRRSQIVQDWAETGKAKRANRLADLDLREVDVDLCDRIESTLMMMSCTVSAWIRHSLCRCD